MDATTHKICCTTNRFYAENAATFSNTREQPWSGWARLTPYLAKLPQRPKVLDAACGNLRFARFLADECVEGAHIFAVDGCAPLLSASAPQGFAVTRIEADIVEMLDASGSFKELDVPLCDLVVSFGFMHHLPTEALRRAALKALLLSTKPDGLCIISFWQFGKDERLAKKAQSVTAFAEESLGITVPQEGDHFLGWQDAPNAFRFCHNFSDAEVKELAGFAEDTGATLLDDFHADGKQDNLNRYLVLRRR